MQHKPSRTVGKQVKQTFRVQIKGFLDFIQKQGVVNLAIGFILGGAIKDLVSAIVNDLLNPILGLFLGAVNNLNEAVLVVGTAQIAWGHLLTAVIDFTMLAAVIYFGSKLLNLDRLSKKK